MSYYVTHENSILNINNAHLKVSGNVMTDVMKLGAIEFAPPESDVPGTVNFTNVTTGVTTTSNLNVGGTLMLGSVELVTSTSALEQTVNLGNTTSNTVQFTNATTGFVTTANIEVGGELTVSGNASVSSNLTVSGNVEVGTANLFVDTVNSRIGIGTTSPQEKLDVAGTAPYLSITDTRTSSGGTTGSDLGGVVFRTKDITDPSPETGDFLAKIQVTAQNAGSFPDGSLNFFVSDDGDLLSSPSMVIEGVTGNVGIGTTSPLETLDTHGTMRSSAPYPRLDFYTTTNRSTNAWGNSTDNAGDYRIYSNGDASDGTKRSLNFDYGQNSIHTTRMAINANGFVGIRTTSPSFPLSVSDASVKQWNAFNNNTTEGDYTFTKSGIYLVGFMYSDGADGNVCEYYTITAATSHGGHCGVTQHKNSGYLNYAVQDHNTVRFWSGSPSNALPDPFNQSNFHLRIYFAGYF